MILDADLLASIRALLGLDETTLPDSLLTDPLLGGTVEREVMAMLGGVPYVERELDEQEIIRAAVAYGTAAAALETGPVREALSTTSERFSDQYTVQKQAADIAAWASRLRAQSASALEPLLTRSTSGFAGMFTLAHGRRGA